MCWRPQWLFILRLWRCVTNRGSGLDRVKRLQNLSPDYCTTSSCGGEVVKCSVFDETFKLLFLSIFFSWSLSLKTGDDIIPLQGPPLPLQHCLNVGWFLLLLAPQRVLWTRKWVQTSSSLFFFRCHSQVCLWRHNESPYKERCSAANLWSFVNRIVWL